MLQTCGSGGVGLGVVVVVGLLSPLACYRNVGTQESPTHAVAVKSSPAHAGFLSGHLFEILFTTPKIINQVNN